MRAHLLLARMHVRDASYGRIANGHIRMGDAGYGRISDAYIHMRDASYGRVADALGGEPAATVTYRCVLM